MIILENMCAEITSEQYIDFVIKKKKTIYVHRLSAICRDVFCHNWITKKGQIDVSIQGVQIYDCSCAERRKKEDSSLYRGYKLFLSKNQFEVVRIDCSIASIPPFRIDILLSSESIWFGAKMTKTEPDNKVELREVFRPPHLPLGQYLGSRKILKIFTIHNNISGIDQTL